MPSAGKLELHEEVYPARLILSRFLQAPSETDLLDFLRKLDTYDGVVWVSDMGGTSPQDGGIFIRDVVMQLADRFANDYLAANPR